MTPDCIMQANFEPFSTEELWTLARLILASDEDSFDMKILAKQLILELMFRMRPPV